MHKRPDKNDIITPIKNTEKLAAIKLNPSLMIKRQTEPKTTGADK